MNWLKRIGILLLVAIALLLGGLAALIAWDVNLGRSAAPNTNFSYTGEDSRQLRGYLARPQGAGPFPAVLMLHEWWGLNAEIPHLAEALAQEGYVVFVPDLYRNRVATTVPGALWMRLTTPEDRIWADADAALAQLAQLDGVMAERLAAVGFCFGGEQALQLGLRRAEDLAGVVIFYGSVVTEPQTLAALAPAEPVLGIFGAEDRQIPVADVQAFEQALDEAEIAHTVSIYEGVGHAFVSADNYQTGTAGDAWRQMVEFLDQSLSTQNDNPNR